MKFGKPGKWKNRQQPVFRIDADGFAPEVRVRALSSR
jgi:hypothetical protein